MFRYRLSLLSILLLAVALWAVPGAAGQSQVPSGPFGVEPPGPDFWRPAYQKAGERPFDPLAQAIIDPKLPVGPGTGAGDVPETEPNDDMTHSDRAADVPFNCTGKIDHVGDVDFMSVSVDAGQHIQVCVFTQMFGGMVSPLDPVMVVLDREGNLIGLNDDYAPGTVNASTTIVAPSSGPIYVGIAGHAGQGGPSYAYVAAVFPFLGDIFSQANYEDEPNNSFGEADPIVLPGGRIGGLPNDDDSDFTYFDAPAGATVVIDVSARVYGFSCNTMVGLIDQSGRTLFVSDDVDGQDPRLNIVLPMTGRYYVAIVPRTGASNSGFYILSVSLQEGAGAPTISELKLADTKFLKKVVGDQYIPGHMTVEVNGTMVASQSAANHPTTQIKVKPQVKLKTTDFVTVVSPTGRRSNPAFR